MKKRERRYLSKSLCSLCCILFGVLLFAGCERKEEIEAPITKSNTEMTEASSNTSEEDKEQEEKSDLSVPYHTLQDIRLLSEDEVSLGKSIAAYVLRDWNVSDLSGYAANGYVQLEVYAEKDSDFVIGFREFSKGKTVDSTLKVEVAAAKEWSSLDISVTEILGATGRSLSEVREFLIGEASENIRVRNVKLVSEDIEKVYPEIKVNQLGYKLEAAKTAVVSGFIELLDANEGDIFELVDAGNEKVVYTGTLTTDAAYDAMYSGEKVLCADFSEYTIAGKYYLHIPDSEIADSFSFAIEDTVYEELLRNTVRYYYYQRANLEITEEYGEGLFRKDQTPKDFVVPLSANREITVDVSGGWYDAGDVGKYVAPGATASNTLLWTYYLFPNKFTDGQNNIPESGNGIPDILDEIKYELDFFLKMQAESGGFYLKVKSQSENDADGDRTVWVGDKDKCTTNATADATATLVFASTIYRQWDEEYADTLLKSAVRGWQYLEQNDDIYVSTTYSGENNKSAMFWASGSLYYATGEQAYKDYFEQNYKYYLSAWSSAYGHSVSNMEIYGFYMYLLSDERDEKITANIKRRYKEWRDIVISRYKRNPWKLSIDAYSFWWGSFNNILGCPQDLYIGDYLMDYDMTEATQMSEDALHFILGENPMRKSYVTGMGEDAISCTFSNFWNELVSEKFPAGYMPGGMNNHNGAILSNFPLRCYAENMTDWVTNENAIYWNAVLVFNAALNQ